LAACHFHTEQQQVTDLQQIIRFFFKAVILKVNEKQFHFGSLQCFLLHISLENIAFVNIWLGFCIKNKIRTT